MTTALGGLLNSHSAIAFSGVENGIAITGGVINVLPVINNLAFSMPRDGVITSMAAFFTNTAAIELLSSTVTVTAQLYQSTAPDNTFTAVPGALVTLAPSITGTIAVGGSYSGLATGLNINVTAGTRLMLVFSSTVTAGLDIATSLIGFTSGGVAIS